MALGWAIILGQPELQPVGKQDAKVVKEVNETMGKMDFKGGVIHVTAPEPRRWMRFGAPGQKVTELIPLFKKLGMKVTVEFSDKVQPEWGFMISQAENGKAELMVTINRKHKDFDLNQLRLKFGSGSDG